MGKLVHLKNPLALFTIAFAGLVRGWWYNQLDDLPEGTYKAVSIIDGLLPLEFYSALWIITSIAFVLGMFIQGRLFVWAGSLTIGLWGLWAVAFIAAYFINDSSSGLTTGTGFAAVAVAALALVQGEVESWSPGSKRVIQ